MDGIHSYMAGCVFGENVLYRDYLPIMQYTTCGN